MKTSGTNIRLRKLLSGIKNNTLIPRPEFQRRLVWANKHKIAFIETVLEGLPFPEIYIAAGEVNLESGEGSEILVDGQQRVTTLYQYFTGSEDIKYGKDFTRYKDLQVIDQENFLEYEVVVRDLGKLDIDTIKKVFQKINSTNYSLNAVEIHNSRYDGAIKKYAEELSEKPFFEVHNIFTNNDIKRMKDLGFALSLIITSMSTYFNLEDEFEEFLERFNDEFPQKDVLELQFNDILELIDSLNFEEKNRVFKKSDIFNLIIELHRALYKDKLKIDNKKLEIELKKFYEMVEENNESPTIQEYLKSVLQGTNNRSSRIKRGEIIYSVIKKLSE